MRIYKNETKGEKRKWEKEERESTNTDNETRLNSKFSLDITSDLERQFKHETIGEKRKWEKEGRESTNTDNESQDCILYLAQIWGC